MMRYVFSFFLRIVPSRRWPLFSTLPVLSLFLLALVAMPPLAVSQTASYTVSPTVSQTVRPVDAGAEALANAVALPDLRQLPAGPQRKDAFLEVLVPIVEVENSRLAARGEWLRALAKRDTPWTIVERERVAALCEDYALECVPGEISELLLKRVAPVPLEMVAVQAVEESGWGTSRLARQNNNLFGMRASSGRYQSFDSVQDAVRAYLKNLNTHGAYAELRARRAQLAAQGDVPPEALIATLNDYATRADYQDVLLSLLRTNAERIRRHVGEAPA
ncbi:glucosaminidase domain-containing protein [Onishia niordana]|uniref:glucosaminidase domain-containing protein n=1 Tax=Onishia niordana TaxID=2508711 RepID=UPI001F114BA3|nr:glucosaminidase domain-containing protein [Halomonas niordiana]